MAIQTFAAPNAGDPVLRFDEIQGDVLIGLQKDFESFVFFTIKDVSAFKEAVRVSILPLLTSAADVRKREMQIEEARAAGLNTRFQFLGLNIGFTHRGLSALGAAPPGLDQAFVDGAHKRAAITGDDIATWPNAFASGAIDGLLLVTGPTEATVDNHVAAVLSILQTSVIALAPEKGATRPERGHEHFGFLDGVSQPGIRGVTKRQNPLDENQGLPGQDLLWPGEFVFGYDEQDPADPHAPRPSPQLPAQWMRDGSFLVWRRLEQKVVSFRETVTAQAAVLGMDEQLLAARMVGRWPSGAPLLRAPLQDDTALGGNELENNDFEFGADSDQRRCPFAAHIRKTYPRDDLNSFLGEAGEAGVQTHRIRRSGIPFGPEVADDEVVGAEASRGLMFVSYQTSIEEQFEFIQQSWVNDPSFVPQKTRPNSAIAIAPGHDPIIAQVQGTRFMDEPLPNYPAGNARSTLNLAQMFVVATAGAYVFVPSLSALKAAPLGA